VFYLQGLRINPTNFRLIYNLARNYQKLNLFDKSITWFLFGLKIKPRWVNGLVGIAITYFEMG